MGQTIKKPARENKDLDILRKEINDLDESFSQTKTIYEKEKNDLLKTHGQLIRSKYPFVFVIKMEGTLIMYEEIVLLNFQCFSNRSDAQKMMDRLNDEIKKRPTLFRKKWLEIVESAEISDEDIILLDADYITKINHYKKKWLQSVEASRLFTENHYLWGMFE